MNEIPKCPKCGSEYTYFDGSLYVCPDCSHEFDSVEESEAADDVARDSNGAELFDGDAVTVIKDLKVKGSSMVIKRGTKVRSIRLTENPEEVDCNQGDGALPRTPKGGGLRRGCERGCLLGGTGARMRLHWTGSACTFTLAYTYTFTLAYNYTFTSTFTSAYN